MLTITLFTPATFGANNNKGMEQSEMVMAKQALVKKYQHNAVPMNKKQLKERSLEVEAALHKIAEADMSGEELEKELDRLGLVEFKYEDGEEEALSDFGIMAASNDVTLRTPVIYYDQYSKQWFVTASGYWHGTSWFGDVTNIWNLNQIKNVGNLDAVGITYYGTSGTPAPQTGGSLNVNDGHGWSANYANPSYGDGSKGIAFEFQDKIQYVTRPPIGSSIKAEHCRFLGKNFSVAVTYSPAFSFYHGKARMFLTHTWDTTYIDSISFNGSNTSFGASVTLKNAGKGWTIFNNADKVF